MTKRRPIFRPLVASLLIVMATVGAVAYLLAARSQHKDQGFHSTRFEPLRPHIALACLDAQRDSRVIVLCPTELPQHDQSAQLPTAHSGRCPVAARRASDQWDRRAIHLPPLRHPRSRLSGSREIARRVDGPRTQAPGRQVRAPLLLTARRHGLSLGPPRLPVPAQGRGLRSVASCGSKGMEKH